MADEGVDYFIRKSREEWELAARSADPADAQSHSALAEEYEKVVAAYQRVIRRSLDSFH